VATVLTIAALAAHLLAVNVAAAGPLAWAWFVGRAAPHDKHRFALGRRMAWLSLTGLAAGAALGGTLLAAPNEPLWAALARFPASTYWFAGAEIAFSALWTLALVWASPNYAGRPIWAWVLASITASNLLYHFPPLMAVIGNLASDPRWTPVELIDRPALLKLWMRPEVLAMWLHFVLASLALAAIAALWPTPDTGNPTSATVDAVYRKLAAAALAATALQAPVGIWVLVTTSPRARDALMGQHVAASALFVAGIVASLGLLQSIAHVALGDVSPALRRRAAWFAIGVAVLMSGTLVMSRRAQATPRRAGGAQIAPAAASHTSIAAKR
jgi:hypothetical protein